MRTLFNKILALGMLLCVPSIGFSQIKSKTPLWDSELMEPTAYTLVGIIFLLILVIAVMGRVLYSTSEAFRSKIMDTGKLSKTTKGTSAAILLILLGSPATTFAQDGGTKMIGGIAATSFYVLITIIAILLLIIILMLRMFNHFASLRNPETAEEKIRQEKMSWIERINKSKSYDKESEEAIMLNHDYDGIVELDNPTPPWWNWFFIISVIYGFAYLWLVHVSKTLPSQEERLEIAYEKAEIAKQKYLEQAGNLIDETNVEYLDNEVDITAGKEIFISVCAACHGQQGEGTVGPNLVDEYWLHGGSVNDIFSVIKYGVPEKGMASWKDQYSPLQIAQLASYIISIGGTEVDNPKDPEGERYVPTGGANDSDEAEEEEASESEIALNVNF